MPVTRPIRLECYADRLVMMPERGASQGEAIPFRGTTQEAVDALLSNVWDRIDTWGIAGEGMYWRPEFNVRVAPGAAGRFADLKSLLEGSGLEVKAKDGP